MRTDVPRLGIPTASNFKSICTPEGKKVTGENWERYRCKMIYERITEKEAPDSVATTTWMERGIIEEPAGAEAFAERLKVKLIKGEFIVTDDKKYGCTPDYLIEGCNEAVEIKTVTPWNHIGYMLYGPGNKYKPQVQGQLMVGGFDCVHFWAWSPDPRFVPLYIPTYRDKTYIEDLQTCLEKFLKEVADGEEWVRRHGNDEFLWEFLSDAKKQV